MKVHTLHTKQVRENIFYFGGFDDWHREFVNDMLDGDSYLLVDKVLHTYTASGEPDIPLYETTNRFNNGFYLGHGCFGNGVVYWDKRNEEFGDYKQIGQVTQNKELIIKTDNHILIEFLKTEAGGK